MDVRVGLWRRLSAEELVLLNCGVGEDSWRSLGLQGDPTSPFWRRSTLGFLWKDDAKAEAPVLWTPHEMSWLIGKDSDAGRDWGQEEKGTTKDEMAGWHHGLDGRESEWTPGDGDGQGGLACCTSWGRRVGHDWATELNWTVLNYTYRSIITMPEKLIKKYWKKCNQMLKVHLWVLIIHIKKKRQNTFCFITSVHWFDLI